MNDQLPTHLERMALFMVNTGPREGELCSLRWDWEQKVPELGTSVFVLPDSKNGQPRVVVLNRIARVHDLRHTFGHRLRAAGVSFEDRQDLIGHKSERMTTHYSAPALSQLIKSVELLCERRPATILRVIGT